MQTPIEWLSVELSLPYDGTQQDWDLEMADHGRIGEFMTFYERTELSIAEKRTLMSLIIASYDSYLYGGPDAGDEWPRIREALIAERETFSELLEYWGKTGEDGALRFRITGRIRKLL